MSGRVPGAGKVSSVRWVRLPDLDAPGLVSVADDGPVQVGMGVGVFVPGALLVVLGARISVELVEDDAAAGFQVRAKVLQDGRGR